MLMVKCDECVEQGLTSKVYCQGSTSTLMGFQSYYDEDGKFHSHDPNRHTTYYACSNGHKFNRSMKHGCGNCDYGNEPVVVTRS